MTGQPTSAPHWHTDAHGIEWFWDGRQWLNPVAIIEERIADMLVSHFESMFVAGYERGQSDYVQTIDAETAEREARVARYADEIRQSVPLRYTPGKGIFVTA